MMYAEWEHRRRMLALDKVNEMFKVKMEKAMTEEEFRNGTAKAEAKKRAEDREGRKLYDLPEGFTVYESKPAMLGHVYAGERLEFFFDDGCYRRGEAIQMLNSVFMGPGRLIGWRKISQGKDWIPNIGAAPEKMPSRIEVKCRDGEIVDLSNINPDWYFRNLDTDIMYWREATTPAETQHPFERTKEAIYEMEREKAMTDTKLNGTPEGFTSHDSTKMPRELGATHLVEVVQPNGLRHIDAALNINWQEVRAWRRIQSTPHAVKAVYENATACMVYEGLAGIFGDLRGTVAGMIKEGMAASEGAIGRSPAAQIPSVCAEADKVIADRHAVYGSPVSNFNDITSLWNAAFGYKMAAPFTPADIAQAMRLVKEARLMNDPTHRDSLVDICGYAQCQNEVANGAVGAAIAPAERHPNMIYSYPEDTNNYSRPEGIGLNVGAAAERPGISEEEWDRLAAGDKVYVFDTEGFFTLTGKHPRGWWIARDSEGEKYPITARYLIHSVIGIVDGKA